MCIIAIVAVSLSFRVSCDVDVVGGVTDAVAVAIAAVGRGAVLWMLLAVLPLVDTVVVVVDTAVVVGVVAL